MDENLASWVTSFVVLTDTCMIVGLVLSVTTFKRFELIYLNILCVFELFDLYYSDIHSLFVGNQT